MGMSIRIRSTRNSGSPGLRSREPPCARQSFRVLKRTLLNDQTLEPTQVAGFNQFFDDFNLTEAWRYGGAIDQKFTSSLFGGVEFSKRDLTFPETGSFRIPPTW